MVSLPVNEHIPQRCLEHLRFGVELGRLPGVGVRDGGNNAAPPARGGRGGTTTPMGVEARGSKPAGGKGVGRF